MTGLCRVAVAGVVTKKQTCMRTFWRMLGALWRTNATLAGAVDVPMRSIYSERLDLYDRGCSCCFRLIGSHADLKDCGERQSN